MASAKLQQIRSFHITPVGSGGWHHRRKLCTASAHSTHIHRFADAAPRRGPFRLDLGGPAFPEAVKRESAVR